VLSCTGVLVGLQALEKGNGSQVSSGELRMRCCLCLREVSVRCVCRLREVLLSDVAPASPFIVSKGRARVTFVVKR
jgi:hypothetical protein